jgi:hypothetical protein
VMPLIARSAEAVAVVDLGKTVGQPPRGKVPALIRRVASKPEAVASVMSGMSSQIYSAREHSAVDLGRPSATARPVPPSFNIPFQPE